MAIVTKETLKSYFLNAKVPGYEEYVDFIDTMGDMNKNIYDTNANNIVDQAANADTVDGSHAADFAPSGYGLGEAALLVSGDWNNYKTTGFYRGNQLANGPTSSYYWVIVIRHADTYVAQLAIYYYSAGNPRFYIRRCVNSVWDSWRTVYPAGWSDIEGKPSTFTPSSHTHGGGDITSAVANATAAVNANTVDNYHASDLYRDNANFATSGYLDTSSYVDAAGGFRINGTQLGNIVLYPAASFLTHTDWDYNEVKAIGQYTLTRTMYGYPSTARYVFCKWFAK